MKEKGEWMTGDSMFARGCHKAKGYIKSFHNLVPPACATRGTTKPEGFWANNDLEGEPT